VGIEMLSNSTDQISIFAPFEWNCAFKEEKNFWQHL
jgi:hypothetical protein